MSWFRRASDFPSENPEIPTPENELLFQSFEWHTESHPPAPNEAAHSRDSHWSRLARILPSLVELGVSSVWLPPGCKANNSNGNGYDCYDLWDLGEFDQKWARSTRWGSREELRDLFAAAEQCGGVTLIWDAVLNHKTAGDATEEAWAVEVDGQDRRIEITSPAKIEAWLKFDFPGREREGMKYSSLKWRAEHFNGTDWDQKANKNAIYKLIDDPATFPKPAQEKFSTPGRAMSDENKSPRFAGSFSRTPWKKAAPPRRPGKGWADDVDHTFGNFDYLMFSNIDFTRSEVREDILQWGQWMIEDVGVHGFRLDAAQHFSWNFTRDWIPRVQAASRRAHGKPALVVGEIWAAENTRQLHWLDAVTPPGSPSPAYAYDAPLLYSFSRISEDVRKQSPNADLRTILAGPGGPDKRALVALRPCQAVTMVTSHDTQLGQTSFTPMDSGLKALFYAFILLRREGLPCVFWGDLYGTQGSESEPPACRIPSGTKSEVGDPNVQEVRSMLPSLMLARKLFAYGPQTDYIDNMSCVGWTRGGTHDRPGCVVLISIASPSFFTNKRMVSGRPGQRWVNITEDGPDRTAVVTDRKGVGVFTCRGSSVSVYVRDNVAGIERFPVGFNHDVYAQ